MFCFFVVFFPLKCGHCFAINLPFFVLSLRVKSVLKRPKHFNFFTSTNNMYIPRDPLFTKGKTRGRIDNAAVTRQFMTNWQNSLRNFVYGRNCLRSASVQKKKNWNRNLNKEKRRKWEHLHQIPRSAWNDYINLAVKFVAKITARQGKFSWLNRTEASSF